MGIAALILGILSIIAYGLVAGEAARGWKWAGMPLAIAGIVLGIIGIAVGIQVGLSVAGLVLSVIGLLIGGFAFYRPAGVAPGRPT